jgi:4-amino-4-deoxy-L-arabinose transferase-like glycosyltransferase
MDLPRSSPARLTAGATLKLPRWAITLMCLMYIVPGLIGRDPWKSEDATGFGVMWTMAGGSARDWLVPNVVGAPLFDSGPLAYWLGALAIRALPTALEPWIAAPLAARAATVLLFLVTASALWYASYLLGRRPAAQPLALAFGGHPEPRDYGRTLGDGALLILLATLGLAEVIHRSSADVGMLAMLCVTLYAIVRTLDRPWQGTMLLAFGLAGIVLTRGPYPAMALGMFWLLLIAFHPDWRASRGATVAVGLPVLIACLLAWPAALSVLDPAEFDSYFAARRTFWAGYVGAFDVEALKRNARNLLWFTLPGGPLALWGLWSWRRSVLSAHVIVPVGYLVATGSTLLAIPDAGDGLPIMMLPGIVMLAAFGLPTLKRGAANAIDWFSLLIYSLVALGLWLSWLARLSGIPDDYAHTMQRLVPGLQPAFHPIAFGVALAGSAAWIWLVRWRVVTHPKVVWRSVVLASGGVAICWTLLMTLWLPEIDYSRSYRDVAVKFAAALPPSAGDRRACIVTEGIGDGQRASFAYFTGVRFARLGFDGHEEAENCPYLLRQDQTRDPSTAIAHGGRWQVIWEGRRASDRNERFRLFRRLKDKAETPARAPAKSNES